MIVCWQQHYYEKQEVYLALSGERADDGQRAGSGYCRHIYDAGLLFILCLLVGGYWAGPNPLKIPTAAVLMWPPITRWLLPKRWCRCQYHPFAISGLKWRCKSIAIL